MPVPAAARRAKRVIESESPSESSVVEDAEEDDVEEDELDDDSDDQLGASSAVPSDNDDGDEDFDAATPEPQVKIKLRVTSAGRGRGRGRGGARGGGAAAVATRAVSTATKRKREPTPEEEEEDEFEDEEGGAISPSKMTARQRARQNKDLQETLIALPDGLPKIKPILTEAERLQKREEMARRRKRQNEQRLQDEQDQTINRLLRAQTGRSRTKLDNASPMPDDSVRGSGAPSGMNSPVRRIQPPAEGVHYRNVMEGDKLVLSISVPPGRDEWIAIGSTEEEDSKPKLGAGKEGQCGVKGCSEKRKYRCVAKFEVGGCSMAHLKEVEKGLKA